MADIKSMLTKMATKPAANGDAKSPAKASKAKKGTIEDTYQKKSQLEHILLRPDTYIGSVEKSQELMWVFDTEKESIVQRQIEYVPGLYKIYDEILVNAADNKQRDKKMDCIKIIIDPETNTISVWNNGQGIPVAMHKEENMYVPSMIFGHLLTSSNYNDEEEKVTGGRNGYGAKLCNIFSTKFVVETASNEYKKEYKQTWGSNMTKTSDPRIKDFRGSDYTKITFCPDLVKFKMDKLDADIVDLMSRRAYDIAASSRGVKVFLNGKRVPVKNFKEYVDIYVKGKEDENGGNLKVIYEEVNDRWEVAITISDRGFQQMSFVNSIATTKGGRHVDYVTDMIVKQLIELLKKKNKGGVQIKPFQVKNHIWIFVNCLIVNPTFDSQTKENMTLQMKSFGSKCPLSEKFITQVTKSGIVESVLTWAKFKAQNELEKVGGKKQSKLKGIPKLEDANEAGTKTALKCTLILTEGDSAKSLAVSGIGVIGRDHYGVFPLKGKLLNVREATHKQILENAEINNLIKILGLHYKKKYNSVEDMKTLRYGKLMIMTDQDQDGSHIKGLLINFIHFNWPELLRQEFLEEFITPIVKAKKRNEELSFYSLPEFEEWKTDTPNHHTYNIKYYKGLGTSTALEAREYFNNMERHRIVFRYGGQSDDDHIILAFSKKHIEQRKEWLTNFMVENKRRKEIGLPERYLYEKSTKVITYTDFVNLELVLFSNADNIRSIPSVVDGLKPGQRKVMYTCFKRNDKREVKVAQLAGSVAEMSAYHHGEVSLCMTIVNLAQNYVGSNNLNLLEPRGQFGTRSVGGKDSASARYIFTKMSPLTRLTFHPTDDALLKYEFDDNVKIEPQWYIPIIPMVLVNGADGIGTGWMTKIPNYNPRDIMKNIRRMLDGTEPKPMIPWYKNFKGTIEDVGDQRYLCSGEIAIVGANKVEITELPVGTWTTNYKENTLEPLLQGSDKVKAVISDFKEYHTDTTVKFVVTIMPNEYDRIKAEGFHKVFKLQHMITTTSMCAFDELGCIRKYEKVAEILDEYYKLRLSMYGKRKDYIEGMLKAEAEKLTNQARFIMEKCDRTLVVENKKRKVIIDELIKRGYEPDPVGEWKRKNKEEEPDASAAPEEEEDANVLNTKKEEVDPEKAFANSIDVKQYDYLLGMSMWMLTDEKKNELLRQKQKKLDELKVLQDKTKEDLWREDLDILSEKLDVVEEKERQEEAGSNKKLAKKGPGKKKIFVQDTLPSPSAKRIKPVITEDIKKKLQSIAKTKENKIKREQTVKQESQTSIEDDEFDSMVKDPKSIKEKLGTPEEIEKKVAKKAKDGMKQTKLNFPKKAVTSSPNGKVNGGAAKRGKKKTEDENDDDVLIINSEAEIEVPVTRPARRNVKAKSYVIDDSDASDADMPLSGKSSDDDDLPLRDNSFVKPPEESPQLKLIQSDSEAEDENKPLPRHETSEDMFDSLVGRKKENEADEAEPKTNAKRKIDDKSDESDNDKVIKVVKKKKTVETTAKKRAPARKKKIESSDEEFDLSDEEVLPSKSRRGGGRKKAIDSDSDFTD